MQWTYTNKFEESAYPNLPGYVPEGTKRFRNKFCWFPLLVNGTAYWLTRVCITEISVHRWYGGSEGGMVVDWDVIDAVRG